MLTYLGMRYFSKMVFVQPALKSDRSPSAGITLRAVTLKVSLHDMALAFLRTIG